MFKTISKELYYRYRDEILRMSNSFQRYEPGGFTRGMSDREIADKLGLSEDEVTEIRCIAEVDTPPLENWEEAVKRKREEASKFIQRAGRGAKKR